MNAASAMKNFEFQSRQRRRSEIHAELQQLTEELHKLDERETTLAAYGETDYDWCKFLRKIDKAYENRVNGKVLLTIDGSIAHKHFLRLLTNKELCDLLSIEMQCVGCGKTWTFNSCQNRVCVDCTTNYCKCGKFKQNWQNVCCWCD